MWTRHVSEQLAAYVDGELPPNAARKVDVHLGRCVPCSSELALVKAGMASLEALTTASAPDQIWAGIEAQRLAEAPFGREGGSRARTRPWRLAFAAVVTVVLIAAVTWRVTRPSGTGWNVRSLEGTPSISGAPLIGAGHVAPGDSIVTDAGSRVAVTIGEIGSVEVAPNTRLRIVTAGPAEHRLALDRGEIRATIAAPPRLFFVDTAAGTAIDLGCEYSLNSDEDGTGLLRVTKGWVSFQGNQIESLVPAGASCQIRSRTGPGLPYFDDASDAMKRGVDAGALDVILAEARARDTLTLWHLLPRVNVAERGRVFDRIAALTPVPAGVTREQVLALDPGTLTRWREELAWTW